MNGRRKINLQVVLSERLMGLRSSAIGTECRSPYMARRGIVVMLTYLGKFPRMVEETGD